MLVNPANLMLLDEPTNHLDFSSQEVLQEAMAQYEGTIIVVSHNRFFVNSFVNKVLEIKDGRATLFEGNIDDYLDRRRREQEDAATRQARAPAREAGAGDTAAQDKKALRRQRAQRREQLGKKLNPLKEQARKAEEQIEQLEARKKDLETMMADPALYQDQQRWAEVSREHGTLARRLERTFALWEEAQGEIEAIESASGPD